MSCLADYGAAMKPMDILGGYTGNGERALSTPTPHLTPLYLVPFRPDFE